MSRFLSSRFPEGFPLPVLTPPPPYFSSLLQKPISGTKQRPPKISKSPSSIQEIEIEVAEVLYGLTRQFQEPSKTEAQTPDSKDTNGSCNEPKSRASSPSCFSPPRATSQSSGLPHGMAVESFLRIFHVFFLFPGLR